MSNEAELISYLKELVDLSSISAEKDKAEISRATANNIVNRLQAIGAEVAVVENVAEHCNPMILGKIITDETKPIYLFYSHYDVQPASKEDGWDTDPFNMVEKDGYVIGRGVSDDKGPIVATYFALKELVDAKQLKVNIGFIYEGQEESGSDGFEQTLEKNRNFFTLPVGGIFIADTAWFDDDHPSMDYGFRGLSYLGIEIQGPYRDQHSGQVGGAIREPMTDLVHLLTKLVVDEKVLIDGFYDNVRKISPEEEKLYEQINFNLETFKKSLGVERLPVEDPKKVMMNLWRNPTLSIHGIEGAFSGPGGKTVIPGKVTAKVSMRLVPDQDPVQISELAKKFIEKEFEKFNSPNKLIVHVMATGDWWLGNIDNRLYKAFQESLRDYWQIEPIFARSGGSIPIIAFMEKIFNAPAVGMAIGQSSDGAHSQNEHLRIKNLVGAKEVIKKVIQKIS